ncbi:hypothetical protein CPter91_4898 [Collimonas pratensis]|uniref:Uncharacterized protein n=1 Tax=Collimonas pratensis TaxID=279113 RepID=A0A127QAW9_9BURK|nr:hypothetical protein CPter91_4898 [Collimonas pratensis]
MIVDEYYSPQQLHRASRTAAGAGPAATLLRHIRNGNPH